MFFLFSLGFTLVGFRSDWLDVIVWNGEKRSKTEIFATNKNEKVWRKKCIDFSFSFVFLFFYKKTRFASCFKLKCGFLVFELIFFCVGFSTTALKYLKEETENAKFLQYITKIFRLCKMLEIFKIIAYVTPRSHKQFVMS